ncbi:MAG: helix-turn-helix domain-containing protein [Myxococcales bacterium]
MNPDPSDLVWKALADSTRRRMLEIIRDTPGCTVGRLCAAFGDLTRTGALSHLGVLERAGLVPRVPKVGRERQLSVDAEPLRACGAWLERNLAAPPAPPSEPSRETGPAPRRRRR